ncbi:lysylphosphatidylglycerol synthase transmembrane domain-containing protein [Aureliella helgolandensis]|uniref:lysylphosphatidylglycerol synthase transmembrane domain-containing protein n=1 Tax=Aureliella helgolandensis TaxID=2527968 RepID=UPI0018D1738A|nr:lysylphosphatidylglycerol synthase transmembrane domain-containing protein [Aureliella helgolandensis]
MKRTCLLVVKLGLPLALFVYLLMSVSPEDYRVFAEQPKQWGLLVLAQCIALFAICLSFLRWYLLVRAFDIPFTISEALRLGFLGYLLNFVSFGSVGGDLFKAILVARDKPEKRPEAVTSVLLDRAVGLLGLVILAWASLSLVPAEQLSATFLTIRRGAGITALGSVVALFLALLAGSWFDRWIVALRKIPVLGDTVSRMALAIRRLRRTPWTLCWILGMAITVHSLLAITMYVISRGVYQDFPTLAEHFQVVPPAMAAGALPLAPGGIGLQEGALQALFSRLPDLPEHYSGMLVATIYRLMTITIAGIGLLFYWYSHHRDAKIIAAAQTPL